MDMTNQPERRIVLRDEKGNEIPRRTIVDPTATFQFTVIYDLNKPWMPIIPDSWPPEERERAVAEALGRIGLRRARHEISDSQANIHAADVMKRYPVVQEPTTRMNSWGQRQDEALRGYENMYREQQRMAAEAREAELSRNRRMEQEIIRVMEEASQNNWVIDRRRVAQSDDVQMPGGIRFNREEFEEFRRARAKELFADRPSYNPDGNRRVRTTTPSGAVAISTDGVDRPPVPEVQQLLADHGKDWK